MDYNRHKLKEIENTLPDASDKDKKRLYEESEDREEVIEDLIEFEKSLDL